MRSSATSHAMTMMCFSGLISLAGCMQQKPPAPAVEAPPPAPYKVVATVKQVMQSITIPASDVVWSVPGEPPTNDEAWARIENNALALAESGNLLMMPGRAKDDAEWMTQASAMIDAASKAVDAARAKDVDRISELGDEIYTTCENCHNKYMEQAQPPQ